MTMTERLAALPQDGHIRYWRVRHGGRSVWMAFWWDGKGTRHKLTLGLTLPAVLPDFPCQHPEKRYQWPVPTTVAEQEEARERGRRGNAARRTRSNQYRKRRAQEAAP